MTRNLYSPRLADELFRALNREGFRRGMPMTKLADELPAVALAGSEFASEEVASEASPSNVTRKAA